MIGKIKKKGGDVLTFAYIMNKLMKKEMAFKHSVSFPKRMWLIRNGFFSASYYLFGINAENKDNYISDFQENYKAKFINRNTRLFDNKLLFDSLISPFVQAPAILGIIEEGRLLPYKESIFKSNDIKELVNYVKSGKAVVVKDIEGASGYGVYKLSYDGENFKINQDQKKEAEVLQFLKKLNNYLINAVLEQADYSSTIFPHSVNTVRVLTMIDPVTDAPFVAAAAHRIGNMESYPVDNCAKGGFTAEINVETGRMGKATQTIVKGKELTWYSQHPDTGAAIEGVEIPGWQDIKSGILKLAANFSFNPLIGWDVVCLKDGSFTILEANDGPDLKLHQIHRPLLGDKRIKSFFQFHNVI